MNEKATSYNPFANIGTATTFEEKIGLVCDVLMGCYQLDSENKTQKVLHYGIFSYLMVLLTLGLPILVIKLSNSERPWLRNLVAILAITFLKPITLLFLFPTMVLMLFASPFIGIAHLFSSQPAESDKLSQPEKPAEINEKPVDYFFQWLTLDSVISDSFTQRLHAIEGILFGNLSDNSQTKKASLLSYLLLGIPRFLNRGVKSKNPWIANFSKVITGLISPLFVVLLLALSLLEIALLPFVGIIHLLAQPVVPGQTPVWKSFLSHPLTWVGLAVTTLAIGLLIQGVNSTLFLSVAAPLAAMIPSFLAIGTLAGLGYLIYSIYLWVTNPSQDVESSEKKTQAKTITNPVMDYLVEQFEWINEYPLTSGLILGIGVSLVIALIILSALFAVGGLSPDTVIGQLMESIFNFMNHFFSTSFDRLGQLPGLEFFASLSTETVALLSQIFSAIALTVGTFCVMTMALRFASTMVRIPENEIYYENTKCYLEKEGENNQKTYSESYLNVIYLGSREAAFVIKNGEFHRALFETVKQVKREFLVYTGDKPAVADDFKIPTSKPVSTS